MALETLRIGLASPRVAASREEGLATTARFLAQAKAEDVAIVCFPETFLPGYRGLGFPTPPEDQRAQVQALRRVCELAREHGVAVIMPMEWSTTAGLLNTAFVVDADGTVQGQQAKCQIAPEEEATYIPGDSRRLFTIHGVRFGIVICHEGWRYPETVRWAVRRGARVVFHPHLSGSDEIAAPERAWGETMPPYFENAMIARAMENTVYYAGVNLALRYPETATTVVAPDGSCVNFLNYGEEGLLVADLDLELATGLYGQRLAPDRYPR